MHPRCIVAAAALESEIEALLKEPA